MRHRRVTESQRQGAIGEGQLYNHFKSFGWEPRKLDSDLGEDLIIDIYDQGASAGLAFYAQVKSSPKLSSYKLKKGDYSYSIETKGLDDHWRDYFPPVVLILWDTKKLSGYWITIEEVLKYLDQTTSGWKNQEKVKVHIPQSNTLDECGLKRLRHSIVSIMLPVIVKGKQLDMKLKFEFPNDNNGIAQQDALKNFQKTGEGITISGRYLKDIQFSDWYERKVGKTEINPDSSFIFGPRHSEQIELIQLTLLNEEGQITHRQNIEIKGSAIGEDQVTFSNKHHPVPFVFSIIVRKGRENSINLSLAGAKTNAHEALAAYDFFYAANKGSILRLEVLSGSKEWEACGRIEVAVPTTTFGNLSESYYDFLEKLSQIETKLGVAFRLTDRDINEDEWQMVHRIFQIIRTGRIDHDFDDMTLTARFSAEPKASELVIKGLIESHPKEKLPIYVDVGKVEGNLLGARLLLGPMKTSISRKLAPASKAKLKKLLALGEPLQEVEFTLLDGHHIEEYSDWLTTEPMLPIKEEASSLIARHND